MARKVREYPVSTIDDFHGKMADVVQFETNRVQQSLDFRGQGDVSWTLTPKAGRAVMGGVDDLERFEHWCHEAAAIDPSLPTNPWECMAVAQHHGFASRLLDWTANPLVAMFFAVSGSPSVDAAVYVGRFPERVNLSLPFRDHQKVALYLPRAVRPRLVAQRAAFTYHPDPYVSLEAVYAASAASDKTDIVKFIVPASQKEAIRQSLNLYAINASSIFPDLDGLSAHVNRETERIGRNQLASTARSTLAKSKKAP